MGRKVQNTKLKRLTYPKNISRKGCFTFSAMHMIYDPQSFAQNPLKQLKTSTKRFFFGGRGSECHFESVYVLCVPGFMQGNHRPTCISGFSPTIFLNQEHEYSLFACIVCVYVGEYMHACMCGGMVVVVYYMPEDNLRCHSLEAFHNFGNRISPCT